MYRDYKKFSNNDFGSIIKTNNGNLQNCNDTSLSFFMNDCKEALDKIAPLKQKSIRANSSPLMNKGITKGHIRDEVLSFALYFEKLFLFLSWFSFYVLLWYTLVAGFTLIHNITFVEKISEFWSSYSRHSMLSEHYFIPSVTVFFKCLRIKQSTVVKELCNTITGIL